MTATAVRRAAGITLGAKRLGLLLLLVFVACCAWLSVRQGLADATAEEALQDMLTWQAKTIELAQVRQAYNTMLAAQDLDPSHPTYLHRLGRLSHLMMTLEPSRRSHWGGLAKEYYRQSLAVRPAWPLTWANLALVKADLLEFDAEMDQSLMQAAAYGPYEPGVLELVSSIGLQYEAYLMPNVLATVYGNIARGLTSPVGRTARSVFGLLEQHSVSAGLIPHLQAVLVATRWNSNADFWFRLALKHWDRWSEEGLPGLRVKLIEKIIENPNRLNLISDVDQLLYICPYLPRKPKFMLVCNRF